MGMQSARETVEATRESLAAITDMPSVLEAELSRCLYVLRGLFEADTDEFEAIELWARLAADLAGMIQAKEKANAARS